MKDEEIICNIDGCMFIFYSVSIPNQMEISVIMHGIPQVPTTKF
jgi:hypothetical protein